MWVLTDHDNDAALATYRSSGTTAESSHVMLTWDAPRLMRMRGTWYIVPTPFDGDGGLDLASLGRLVEAAIAWGVDGLTVMGVMAEPGALTPDERAAALRAVFDAAPDACRSPWAARAATLSTDARADRPGPRSGRLARPCWPLPHSCATSTSCRATSGRPRRAACRWCIQDEPDGDRRR